MTRTITLHDNNKVTSRVTPSHADKITEQNIAKWQEEKRKREFAQKFLRVDERVQNVPWEKVKIKYC